MQARESTGATTWIIQALSHNIKQKVVTVDKTESLKAQRNSYLEFWSFFFNLFQTHLQVSDICTVQAQRKSR